MDLYAGWGKLRKHHPTYKSTWVLGSVHALTKKVVLAGFTNLNHQYISQRVYNQKIGACA